MDTKTLIRTFAKENDLDLTQSKKLITSLFDMMSEQLMTGDFVKINRFGVFEVRTRDARQGFNPRTGETLEIPAKHYPAFKPAKALKDAVRE